MVDATKGLRHPGTSQQRPASWERQAVPLQNGTGAPGPVETSWLLCPSWGVGSTLALRSRETAAPQAPSLRLVPSLEAAHLLSLSIGPPLSSMEHSDLGPLCPGAGPAGLGHSCTGGRALPVQSSTRVRSARAARQAEHWTQQAMGLVLLGLQKQEGCSLFTVVLARRSRPSQCHLLGTFTCPESVESLRVWSDRNERPGVLMGRWGT